MLGAVLLWRHPVPAPERTPGGATVACHRWREIDAQATGAERRAAENPVLARLQAAFTRVNDGARDACL